MKLHEFPNGLLGLKQLRILDLSQNNLTTVPEVIVKISLQGCRILVVLIKFLLISWYLF
jgi:Leucine-rich repeat (LRR) protein